MMIPSRMVLGGTALIMALGSATSRAEAAEWSAQPSVGLRGEYNSNLLLSALPHEAVYGYWVSPGVKFAGSTENLEVSGRAAADFVQYFGGSDRSLTNLYFPLSVQYTKERETLAFEGGFIRDNTLMGELRQTGVVLAFTQRNLWNLAPSWTHALTERWSVQAGYQYSDATYEDGASLGLVDYSLHGGSGAVLYQPTERDEVKFTGIYTNFHAPQANDLRSQIYSGQLSVTHRFSESITATLMGGPSYVRSVVGPGAARLGDNQTVWVGNATLLKKWEDAAVQLEAAREINPSGFGLLLQTDKFGVSLSKTVSEQWTASLSAHVLFASSIASQVLATPFPLQRFVSVSPRVTWKPSQWWALDFTYSYGNRQVESTNESAFANIASVMLTYFPPKLSVGR